MGLAFDARVRPRSSFARVLELFEEAARAVDLPYQLWRGDACDAEVLWCLRQAELALPDGGPRQVATLYDVNPLLPDGRPALLRWRRARRFRRQAGAAVTGAWRLATDSEDAAQRLQAAFPAAAGRTGVIPLYPEAHFQPDGPPSDLAEPGYVLFLGALRRHKNWEGLLRAYALLPARLRAAHPLLLAGRARRAARRLLSLLDALALRDQVRVLDEVPEDQLPGLYRGAAAFAFPSLMEGFGLPPLEAMACGAPVVSSDRTSLPEVLGDAATLVDPLDATALARALEQLLTDPACAQAHREAGLAQAATYGPDRAGQPRRSTAELGQRDLGDEAAAEVALLEAGGLVLGVTLGEQGGDLGVDLVGGAVAGQALGGDVDRLPVVEQAVAVDELLDLGGGLERRVSGALGGGAAHPLLDVVVRGVGVVAQLQRRAADVEAQLAAEVLGDRLGDLGADAEGRGRAAFLHGLLEPGLEPGAQRGDGVGGAGFGLGHLLEHLGPLGDRLHDEGRAEDHEGQPQPEHQEGAALHDSSLRTAEETVAPSARPAALAIRAFITAPISFMELAPVSAMASLTRVSSSASLRPWGR